MTVDRYAVFGNPIAHSKSPLIHRLFAEQSGSAMQYTAQQVALDKFAGAARDFFVAGGKGLNITVPFKQDAWRYAQIRSPDADRAGAVNTLALQPDGSLYGANTDGIGLLKDLRDNLGWLVEGKRLLLIGAGGAARGVLQPLLQHKPQQLTIANRTPGKAEQLAHAFDDLGNVEASDFVALQDSQFDLLINATAASLHGELPPLPAGICSDTACAYDMLYTAGITPFNAWAKQHGARHVADGLGMLVEQAAESFHIWRGVRPDTAAVIENVRANLNQRHAAG